MAAFLAVPETRCSCPMWSGAGTSIQNFHRAPKDGMSWSLASGSDVASRAQFHEGSTRRDRDPVAIADGEHDEIIKAAHTKMISAEIPRAKLVFLPGVSHFAMLQNPDLFNQPGRNLRSNIFRAPSNRPENRVQCQHGVVRGADQFPRPRRGGFGGSARREARQLAGIQSERSAGYFSLSERRGGWICRPFRPCGSNGLGRLAAFRAHFAFKRGDPEVRRVVGSRLSVGRLRRGRPISLLPSVHAHARHQASGGR